MRSTGSYYRVREANGTIHDCSLRGKFRLEGLRTTNPVAVGDRVVVTMVEGPPVITAILPRDNYILRRATKLSSQSQMLCANVDQAVIVVTIERPFTPLGFVDRFLVMCEAYHVPAVVVLNKIDLLKQNEERWEHMLDYEFIYKRIGYPTYMINATDTAHAEVAQALFHNKTTFIAGVSGSGKSTLANLVDPTLTLRVGEISEHSEKGKHTTTYAEMHTLTHGGYIIDAPGFREFEIVGISRQELSGYFPEMRALINQCRFNNCSHTNEPECAIKQALDEDKISPTRYHTYLGMLENMETDYER